MPHIMVDDKSKVYRFDNTTRRVLQGDPPDLLVSRRKDGILIRKRVSSRHRKLCPIEAQLAYRKGGPIALTKWFIANQGMHLTDAAKAMNRARGFGFQARMDEWGNLIYPGRGF